MAETREIGVGVIGFGLACRVFHAPFVSAVPGLKLVAIVQRKGNEAAEAYPAAKIVRSVEELLADPAVEVVVIATPNETHYALAKQCLEAGKHIVIDKPFTATSAEALEVIALARAQGLLAVPFHNRRWDGDFLTVKKIVEEKKVGRLVTFESHFDRYRPIMRENTWKEAGDDSHGLLFDLAPHLVDQVTSLFGKPKTITASVRKDRDGSEVEDAFDITLGYDGLLAMCRSSMLACDASPRFLLHGTAGSFKKFGLDPQEPALLGGAQVPLLGSPEEWLEEEEALWGTLTTAPVLSDPGKLEKTAVKTEPGDYRPFYVNVRNAVLGKEPLIVTPEDGYQVVKIMELARVSSKEGRTVAFEG